MSFKREFLSYVNEQNRNFREMIYKSPKCLLTYSHWNVITCFSEEKLGNSVVQRTALVRVRSARWGVGWQRPGPGKAHKGSLDREPLGKEGSRETPGFWIGWLCECWCSLSRCKYRHNGRTKTSGPQLATRTCNHTIIYIFQSNFSITSNFLLIAK